MKIIKFYGGLGNQLFQYAMLVAVREHFKEEVLMDTSVYASYGLHNGLEMNRIFATTAKEATQEQIKKVSWCTTNYILFRLIHYCLPAKKTEFKEWTFGKYYAEVFDKKCDCLYDGYWQHHEYFKDCRDAILKEFSLRNPLDEENQTRFDGYYSSENVASVHVRRGDFLNSKLYKGLCGKDYFRAAIAKAKSILGDETSFVFFSNDLQWCKENLSDLIAPDRICFAEWNTGKESYKDMILMSACRVNIIANSSFSWWAAYLNQRADKIVIAPAKWINKKMPDPIQMPDWILI